MDKPLSEQELCESWAEMWNCLDLSVCEQFFADDIVWTSQEVFTDLTGKRALLEYLRGKMNTLRDRPDSARVFAELGFLGSQDGWSVRVASAEEMRPCVVIAQGGIDKVIGLAILTTADGVIQQVDLCSVAPHPSTAIRTGHYPGLDKSRDEWSEMIE